MYSAEPFYVKKLEKGRQKAAWYGVFCLSFDPKNTNLKREEAMVTAFLGPDRKEAEQLARMLNAAWQLFHAQD